MFLKNKTRPYGVNPSLYIIFYYSLCQISALISVVVDIKVKSKDKNGPILKQSLNKTQAKQQPYGE
jgi:hypothetical protein